MILFIWGKFLLRFILHTFFFGYVEPTKSPPKLRPKEAIRRTLPKFWLKIKRYLGIFIQKLTYFWGAGLFATTRKGQM